VTFEADTLGGISGIWVRPAKARPGEAIIHLHGGWFNFGSAKGYRHLVGHIAARAGVAAFVPDYRLAPDHPFPAATDDALACCGPALQLLLEETDAEYADIYNVGIDPELLKRAGFRCVDPDGPEIVPDHFEPFEPRNIRLWYSLKGSSAPVLFKGDADQDRPNRGLRTWV